MLMNSNFRLHNLIGFPIKDLILEMSSGPRTNSSILGDEVLHHIINNKPPISHRIMMVGFHMSRNKLEVLRMGNWWKHMQWLLTHLLAKPQRNSQIFLNYNLWSPTAGRLNRSFINLKIFASPIFYAFQKSRKKV